MQGNAEFKTEGDRVRPAQQSSLATVAQLLNVDQTELGRALCHRVIAANGELMEKGHTASEAVYGRDAFAKVTVSFPFLSLSLSLSLSLFAHFLPPHAPQTVPVVSITITSLSTIGFSLCFLSLACASYGCNTVSLDGSTRV